jgi:hypothetical protein
MEPYRLLPTRLNAMVLYQAQEPEVLQHSNLTIPTI